MSRGGRVTRVERRAHAACPVAMQMGVTQSLDHRHLADRSLEHRDTGLERMRASAPPLGDPAHAAHVRDAERRRELGPARDPDEAHP
jgi:hypothetical protein